MQKRLPIGIENFEEMVANDYYYVDKTGLIKEILDKGSKVSLFTRPRRFGKTLNMSMLRCFFEKPIDGGSRRELFEGLQIAEAGQRYAKHQEQYPVISLTLKSAKQPTYALAWHCIKEDIGREFFRHRYVLDADELSAAAKAKFEHMMNGDASDEDYLRGFAFLSECLCQYHKQQVIILLDEYDVPLENAYYAGFYDEMTACIRSLFESALKTNDNLFFAVITGCLRISRESIFTGLNNMRVNSIMSMDFAEYFGFRETEVFDMLAYYDRVSMKDTVRKWYDGYRFGELEVYNPWSVINYVQDLVVKEDALPTTAWANSSANAIIHDLIYRSDDVVQTQIQALIDGETIETQIHEDMTYGEMYDTADNLWNFLYFTGYLKAVSIRMDVDQIYASLAIPNTEVRTIYKNHINLWFKDKLKEKDLAPLYEALTEGDEAALQRQIADLLMETISYMDSAESFYHGFMLGILAHIKGYGLKSNREAGAGRYDIAVISRDIRKSPVIIEIKTAQRFRDMEAAAQASLQQILDRQYAVGFAEDGYREVICYGIGFFRKQLRICMQVVNIEAYI